MVVLDSFPFQEDSDVQYLGGVRRSAHSSAAHLGQREVLFNSPLASVVDSGNYSTTVYQGRENEEENGTGIEHSQGYMEGAKNANGYMKCRLCHYETKIESLLRRHVIKHSLDADFRCPACDWRENDPSKFVDHIGTHQSGKLVRCCFCPKKMTRGKLKSHIRVHRAVGLYDCSMCQFSTNYEKTIKSHMDVYHTKEHSCHQCNLIMTKHELHWHMKFVHSMELTEAVAVREPAVPLPVPAGRGTNSKTPSSPETVLPNQSAFARKFGTSKISWKTSKAVKMQKHFVAKKQFNCGKCDYKTPFKKLLRAHRAKHSLDNSLVCTKCGFKETGSGKFASHLGLHSPDDLFECCFCGFRTPTRSTMSNHVTKHKPVPMFDCAECEFSAKRPASVRIHTANVHGKRSRCTICGVEMSRFAMLHHRKECRSGKILNPAASPSQNLESEEYESDGPDTSYGAGDFSRQDDNLVSCEFCNKPYAKSYVRKHAKKCQVENAPDPETRKSELEAVMQPAGKSLANDDGAPMLNTNRISDDPQSERSQDFDHLQSKSTSKSSDKPKKPHLQCNSCLFKTKKKRLLKKHAVKHLIDFRLTCPECGHKEMSVTKFAHHILQHGSNPDMFQCCFCSVRTPTTKRSYCSHLDLHRPVNIFDCPKCEYSSNRADNVKNHFKNNHAKTRKCIHCGEVMSRVRLTKHLLETHCYVRDVNSKSGKADKATTEAYPSHAQRIKSTDMKPDDISGQLSSQRPNIEDEMQEPAEIVSTLTEREQPDVDAPLFETDQDFFKCTKCSFKTKIQSLMDRHTAKHLEDTPFVCPLCGFEHMSSRKFANHWDKHECNAKTKIYLCCFCDTEIKKKNCLKAFLPHHIEGHRPVALQDCPECEFSSHSRYELDKHFKNQHVKRCECLLCGEVMTIFEYSFHTECKGAIRVDHYKSPDTKTGTDHQSVDFSSLRLHSVEVQESLVAALEDPASLCDPSPSSFADGSSTRVDPASRPNCVAKRYMHCSTCDYQTPFKSLLKRHALKHLVDVPFYCKNCSFSSFDERTFADHIFSHTNSYKCHFCSHRAVNAAAAARHFSSHKVLAIHDCPKCEFTSTYKYRLVEHLRGRHVNVPRCSYCGRRMSKAELKSHERVCDRSLRRKRFAQSKSSSKIGIPAGRLMQVLDATSPHLFAESYDHIEGTSNQGLIDQQLAAAKKVGRAYDTAMKGLLLHQLNLAPTQGALDYDAKSAQLADDFGMVGSVHHSKRQSGLGFAVGRVDSAIEGCQRAGEKVLEMTKQSVAVTDSPSQDPKLKHLICPTSTADHVPAVVQESNSTVIKWCQDPVLNDTVFSVSSAETPP